MTIGPEPMTRIFAMSFLRGILFLLTPGFFLLVQDGGSEKGASSDALLLPLFHHLAEVLEQIMRVMRSRRRLRMILHTEHRMLVVLQPGTRLVVQIDVRYRNVRTERFRVDRVVMVLRCDLDLACFQVLDRMIRPVMTKLQLVSVATKGQTKELMSKADAEHRRLACEITNVLLRIVEWLRIAGAVREEDPVGIHGEHIRCGGLRRYHGDGAVLARQHAKNILLDTEVIRDHMHLLAVSADRLRKELVPGFVARIAAVEGVLLLRRDDRCEIGAVH